MNAIIQDENLKNKTKYIGTTKASMILGLSIGTIQKLVDKGILPAYSTKGKHRRIPYDAIVDYYNSRQGKLNNQSLPPIRPKKSHRFCIIFDPNDQSSDKFSIIESKRFEIINNPLQFLENLTYSTYTFIDAGISWLDWNTLTEMQSNNIHCIIYNASKLTNEQRFNLQNAAVLYDQMISMDFLNGCNLGISNFGKHS